MPEEAKKGFWQTLPGIITGITALITAIAGLLIALSQTGLLGGSKASVAVATVPTEPSPKVNVSKNDSFDFNENAPGKKLLQFSFIKPTPFELNGVQFNVIKNKHRMIDVNKFGMLLFVNIKPTHSGGSREKVELKEDGVIKPIVDQKNKSMVFTTGEK
jgi:hypothetical protein